MNRHRSSRLVTGGAAVLAVSLLVTGAAGCGKGKKKSRSSSSSVKHGTDGGVTYSATPEPTRTSSASPFGPCRSADLTATIQIQAVGSALVVVTNKGRGECSMNGYPVIGGRLGDDSDARVVLKREPYPGPPTRVTLKPGASAYAGLKWTTCSKSDPKCVVVATAVFSPPDDTAKVVAQVTGLDGKPLAGQLPVAASGVTVGSLQSSRQGVLFK